MNDEQTSPPSGRGCSWLLIVAGALALLGAFSGNALITLLAIVVGLALIGLGLFALWGATIQGRDTEVSESNGPQSSASANLVPTQGGRPVGEDFESWTTPDRMQAIVGEFYQQAGYARLARRLDIPHDGTRATVDLAADLGLDRKNPHARHGTAIAVWIEGVLAGYLPDTRVPDYLSILEHLEEDGKHLTVRARVYLNYDSSKAKWRPSTMLKLPEPDGVLPRNPMPTGDLELIPAGRVIQTTGEENHMDYLGQIVDPSGPSHYVATLRPTQMGSRTFYDTVQVLIDGNEVGTFSRAMGEQTAPLVKLIEAAGKTAVARATLEGNALRVEVKVRMQRAAEFDHDRVRALQELARERQANTNHRGETFEWDDDDLATGFDTSQSIKLREQQGRDAEDGGA